MAFDSEYEPVTLVQLRARQRDVEAYYAECVPDWTQATPDEIERDIATLRQVATSALMAAHIQINMLRLTSGWTTARGVGVDRRTRREHALHVAYEIIAATDGNLQHEAWAVMHAAVQLADAEAAQ